MTHGRDPALHRLGPLGFGTSTLGNLYEAISDELAGSTVEAAWDAGIRYFDTAPHYGLGLSERRLGRALVGRPQNGLVLSTKVGRLIEDGHPPRSDLDSQFDVTSTARRRWDFTADGVRRSMNDSLERLGLDRIHIALVHDPDEHVEEAIDEAVPALCRLRDEGIIDAVGVGTNDAGLATRFVTACDLDVVMIAGRYTLLDQSAARELLPGCLERGIGVVAAAPFNSGLLASRAPATGGRFDYAAAPEEIVGRAAAIAAVCEEHGVDLPQAALRFPLQHPAVATVVASARTPTEVTQNAGRAIAAAARGAAEWAELWTDLRARGLIAREG